MHTKEILEFINRRFPIDCFWTSGNCFFFATILKERFKSYNPEIYYDVIDGHFLIKIDNAFYDYDGLKKPENKNIILWDKFEEYDKSQKEIIIRDCIK